MSTGHRKPTNNPTKTSFYKAKMHTNSSRLFCHTAHTRAYLISFVGGATPPPHYHTHFTPSLPFRRPHSPHKHTGVVCLINLAGVKGHTGRRMCPTIVTSPLWASIVKHGPTRPPPNGSNKTCINVHTHTLHTGLVTHPQA